ncbi:MAG: hypothetical protein LLG37_01110 [Spirochaetia bacterium]|nr:hypothetical protein [Spirochaetia bacterium]
MFKKIFSFNINGYTEKALKAYCNANNITADEFMEEAIIEKLETEEMLRSEAETVLASDMVTEQEDEGFYNAGGDLYKKKH